MLSRRFARLLTTQSTPGGVFKLGQCRLQLFALSAKNRSATPSLSLHTSSCLNVNDTDPWEKLQSSAKTGSKWFLEEFNAIKSAPKPAQFVGYGSLVPFLIFPAGQLLSFSYIPELAFAQIAYNACILSLAGGVRWGITLPAKSDEPGDAKAIGCAVIPTAVAWGSLQLSVPLALLVQGCAAYFVAATDAEVKSYPRWFMGITNSMVTLAIGCAMLTLLCRIVLSEKDEKKGQ